MYVSSSLVRRNREIWLGEDAELCMYVEPSSLTLPGFNLHLLPTVSTILQVQMVFATSKEFYRWAQSIQVRALHLKIYNSLLTSSKSLILSPFRALLGRLRRTPHLLLSHGGIASSSSNTIRSYRYDVFISFRGVDTRNNLVDHLYNHLDRKGIFVFKDDQRLQKGEFISPQLVQAIKDSRLSIIVFSTNYASSSWCLDEMATIVECHQQFNQTVYPVFYDVDPSHVRKQNGVYEKAFALHTQNFRQDPSKVYQWKTAMTTLAKSAGWDVRNKPEFEEIENIVQAVTKKLGHRFSGFADNLDQCIRNPALWSRLWLHRDLYQVLMTQSETNNVEAIVLRQEDDVFMCKAEGFSKLKNLKLLILYQNSFEGTLDFLSNNLRYLFWHGYPFPSLPSKFKPYSLTELNLPESRIQRLWEGRKSFSFLERVDLSNSKCLIETPDFELCREIKRLDLTGCTNLSQVHSSIGLLSKLTYLSLRNCSNLVSLDFRNACNLSSLKVLSLSGCTKLESMPDITGASNLEYLDIEGCTSLSTLHESIGTLSKNKFLSLKDCTNLVSLPDSINSLTSLMTLHLCGCSKLAKLPLNYAFSDYSFCMKSLIFLDLGFCNLLEVPDAIGELRYLERLDLQGNKFYSVPDSINKLSCLAYLNLAHCHNLGHLPLIPSKSESLVGRYFQTTSGSRDHRSGLYVFDCPKLTSRYARYVFTWLTRLVKQPRHFRCGFDIVTPRSWDVANLRNSFIPNWFDHKFTGESIISIVHCDVDDDWIGFAFCVAFEADNPLAISSSSHHSSSSPLPHPFYLSCESEYTEQRFDMTLNLELDKSDDSQHFWTIYISKEHCHFIESGANITFKSCPGLVVKEWGLRRVVKQDIEDMEKYIEQRILPPSRVDKSLIIEYIKKRSSSSMPKIQLPYNWLVNEEDEVENFEAKAKENDLCNLGL
ncbi:hypothetical protein RJT34_29050 [Clitoria ternatea]|uniref:TIR domain-containing protein n=1 Tax=Clitoria ternatea TaxID=43366 RepID=A0AAN9FIF6_CLITE